MVITPFEDQFDDNGILLSSGLNQFLTIQNSDVYQHGYSLVGDGTVGDESAWCFRIRYFQLGLYVQDDIQVTDNLKATLGFRIDVPYWSDGTVNEDFNTRTVGLLEAAGKRFTRCQSGSGDKPNCYGCSQNWILTGMLTETTPPKYEGDLGVFTSRLPLVWPGGTYNNNGVTGGFMFEFDQPFEPDVNNQFKDPASRNRWRWRKCRFNF